jgi:TldD protein
MCELAGPAAAQLAAGHDWAELYVNRRLVHTAHLDGDGGVRVNTRRNSGIGARVLDGPRQFTSATDGISPPAFDEAVANCAATAHTAGSGTSWRDLLTPFKSEPVNDEPDTWLDDHTTRIELCQRAADAARAVDRIVHATALCSVISTTIVIANSVRGLSRQHRVRSRTVVTVETSGHTAFEVSGHLLDGHDTPELVAARAVDTVLAACDAGAPPSGPTPVVFAPAAGATLLHEICGHLLEGDVLNEGPIGSWLGRQIAGEYLTVHDDPTVPGNWGSYRYDDEGNPARRTTLLAAGVVTGGLFDSRTALKAETALPGNARRESHQHPTTPRMSNLFVEPTSVAAADVVGDVRNGLFVGGINRASVHPRTGRFQVVAGRCRRIDSGVIGQPVRDVLIEGTSVEALRAIVAVADDFATMDSVCGKNGQEIPVTVGSPTMLVTDLSLKG